MAIKRVLHSKKKRTGSTRRDTRGSVNNYHSSTLLPAEMNNSAISQDERTSSSANPLDLEADISRPTPEQSGTFTSKKLIDSDSVVNHHFSLAFMNKDIRKKYKWLKLLPGGSKSIEEKSFQLAVIGNESFSRSERLRQFVCPWFDQARQRREDFKTEMRVLARLRHPCITTGKQVLRMEQNTVHYISDLTLPCFQLWGLL